MSGMSAMRAWIVRATMADGAERRGTIWAATEAEAMVRAADRFPDAVKLHVR